MTDSAMASALHLCVYRKSEAHDLCGRPATKHYLVVPDPIVAVMVCAEHEQSWTAGPIYDQHPVRGACGLPGTWWMDSHLDPSGVGYCYVEGIDTSVLAGAELATAGASA